MQKSSTSTCVCKWLMAVLLLQALCSGCGESGNSASPVPADTQGSHAAFRFDGELPASPAIADRPVDLVNSIHWTAVADNVSIDHSYLNGASGKLLMIESLGGGAGWLDFNGDGLLDCYLTQGDEPGRKDRSQCASDELFAQVAAGGFERVGHDARIDARNYGMGVTVGDFDNDGFDDLYVSNVGANQLFRNLGDGTFQEVGQETGTDTKSWSSSCAWADLDLDGDLDLYVCNYLMYDPLHPLLCEKDGLPALCHPRQIEAWPDECYENLGDGRFRAMSRPWGLYGEGNKALGVAVADFNNDDWPDIYVANDTTANFLFINDQTGHFSESAVRLGAAISGEGAMQASMGIGVGDYDRDGMLDIVLSHFSGESNTLYRNLGNFGFDDVSVQTLLRAASFSKLGFGIVMQDFDCSGTPEMLVANGHIDERNADGDGYLQHPQVLSLVDSKWLDCSKSAGAYFSGKYVGRGIATGDYDQDGDLDAMMVHQNAPAELLRNDSDRGHWLTVQFAGRTSNRRGIGCRVTLTDATGKRFVQELAGGTSYCSSHQHVLSFGTGNSDAPVSLKIRWPSGRRQHLDKVSLNQQILLIEPEDDESGEVVSIGMR